MRETLAILCLLTLLAAAGCTHNPATGRNQLLLLSSDEEIALGTEAMPQLVTEYGGAVTSSQINGYVTGIGVRLGEVTEGQYQGLPWEFTVLDSDVINAFALPGGKVFISRGLMQRLSNESQLAGVLGHEVGHVTSQHIDERLSHAMVAQGLAVTAGVLTGSSDNEWAAVVPLVVGAGGQGYMLKFGRDQELEADRQGVKYMTRLGYDPKGMRQVLVILKEAASGQRQPEFLSTHPDPDRRIAQLDQMLVGDYRHTQGSSSHRMFPRRYEREVLSELGPVSASAMPVGWCAVCAAREAAAESGS